MLQEYALKFGSQENLTVLLAKEIKHHSRKAKTKHIYELRLLFFHRSSVWNCCEHMTSDCAKDSNGDSLPPKLNMRFAPSLKTPLDLQRLLFSNKFHTDKVFYPFFVEALSQGKLSKIKKQKEDTPLSDFINPGHEAHFRLELWYCLSNQCKYLLFFSSLSILVFCFYVFIQALGTSAVLK